MPRPPAPWPEPGDLDDHWQWRPEWAVERPCWYWYLTFDADTVVEAVGSALLSAARAVPWLDPVPPAWLHLTVCDVGFTDELEVEVVREVAEAVAPTTAGLLPVELELGPVVAMHGAVVLAAGPLDRLRRLGRAVGSATQRVLGPQRPLYHRDELWPHVSLGYVNRAVPRRQVAATLTRWPHQGAAKVEVDRLRLVSVTRRDRHYQWQVSAEVMSGTSSPLTTPGHRGSR
jgi:2'-5' RNA ligase